MRKSCLLIALTTLVCGCTKQNTYYNNTTLPNSQPAFAVNGLTSVLLRNDQTPYATLLINVAYLDSAQQTVSLTLNGIPNGITVDTSWIKSGIPTYNTNITFYDTLDAGAVPGTYPLTLTATTASGNIKTYPFDLIVKPYPTAFLGKYNNCINYCVSPTTYSDSLYADVTERNKIWFSNFGNSGVHVYGLIGKNGQLTIPPQTIAGVTFSANNFLNFDYHVLDIYVNTPGCRIQMF